MFDLKIYFTGIMLFVVEDDGMHVLMPQTSEFIPATVQSGDAMDHSGHAGRGSGGGPHDDHPVEPHVARLTFDTAHTRPGAKKEDGVIAHVSLRKTRLEIPRLGDASKLQVPRQIAPAPRPVRRDVVDGKTAEANDLLAARVHVVSGKATGVGRGLCWKAEGHVRRLPHQVEWTISNINANSLKLKMTGPEGVGQAGSGVPELFPINGEPIELFIWHAPPFELPPGGLAPAEPQPGDINHHISHVEILLEPAKEGEEKGFPRHVLVGDDCDDKPGEDAGEDPGKSRGREPDRGGLSLPCTPVRFP
jgi:hypothetical protein